MSLSQSSRPVSCCRVVNKFTIIQAKLLIMHFCIIIIFNNFAYKLMMAKHWSVLLPVSFHEFNSIFACIIAKHRPLLIKTNGQQNVICYITPCLCFCVLRPCAVRFWTTKVAKQTKGNICKIHLLMEIHC